MSNLHNYELIIINPSLIKHTASQRVSSAPLSPLHFANESSLPIHFASNPFHTPTCTIIVLNPSTIPYELSANDYFQKRNVQLTEENQEYALLTRYLKKRKKMGF